MNYPAAPMSGIYASLRQATGYQSEVIITPQEAGNLPASGGSNLYPPQEGLSAFGGLKKPLLIAGIYSVNRHIYG